MISIELQEKINKFNDNYGINFNLESIENAAKISDTIDSFKFNKKGIKMQR